MGVSSGLLFLAPTFLLLSRVLMESCSLRVRGPELRGGEGPGTVLGWTWLPLSLAEGDAIIS